MTLAVLGAWSATWTPTIAAAADDTCRGPPHENEICENGCEHFGPGRDRGACLERCRAAARAAADRYDRCVDFEIVTSRPCLLGLGALISGVLAFLRFRRRRSPTVVVAGRGEYRGATACPRHGPTAASRST